MSDLLDKLQAARDEVARLELAVAAAPCHEVGHHWRMIGGKACCCEGGGCSIPVHECEVCGDFDYGDNQWGEKTRRECREERDA